MRDRLPLYPGRVKLVPVSGQENVYDMTRADQPTQEGDPLNKATLLKDATAALFGLGTDAVPDDVLALLSKAALYKTVTPDIQLGTLNEGDIFILNENGEPVEFYVAKKDYEASYNSGRVLVVRKYGVEKGQWNLQGINAYDNSIIDTWFNQTYLKTLDEQVQVAISETNIPYTPMRGTTTVKRINKSVFALSLTELGRSDSNARKEGSSLPIVSSLIGIDQWTRTQYFNAAGVFAVTSSGSALSNNVSNNNYYYRPAFTLPSSFNIGKPTTGLYDVSDNLLLKLPGVQIATGSYVGTGKYGESNPNSLTFEFEPKFVFLFSNYASGNSEAAYQFVLMINGVQIPAIPIDYSNVIGSRWTIKWLSNTVSWYSTDSALAQANSSEDYNKNYVYFAIG